MLQAPLSRAPGLQAEPGAEAVQTWGFPSRRKATLGEKFPGSRTEEQHVQDTQQEGSVRSMVGRVETFSFVPLFPPRSLWQGASCCSAPRGAALPSCRAQQSGRWRCALGWCCPLPPGAPQPWLCPCRGSRTRRLHLSQPTRSGCPLSPRLMLLLAWCSPATLSPQENTPFAPTSAGGAGGSWLASALGAHHGPQPSSRRALRRVSAWLEEPLAQESRNSAAWAGGRGWADARQTGRHQAGCMGLAGGEEELPASAFAAGHRDAPAVLLSGLGVVVGEG